MMPEGLMNKITICTPTYNRDKVLPRLYNSLKKQTNQQFVWLIIDDGSVDKTETLVQRWIKDGGIDIQYIKQENAGKSMAHNRGVQMTTTELFCCLDSNDCIAANAIEMILQLWKKVKQDEKVIGIMSPKKAQFKDVSNQLNLKLLPKYLKIKRDKKPLKKAFGDSYYIEEEKIRGGHIKTTLKDAYRKYGLKGEAMLVFRTDIISKFRFPYIEGEKFVPEAYLYDRVDQEGKLIVLNKTLCVHRYQADGYTFNMAKLIKDNPKGYLTYIKQRIYQDTGRKPRFFNYIRYISVAKIINEKNYIIKSDDRLTALAAYPFGIIFYFIRYKNIK